MDSTPPNSKPLPASDPVSGAGEVPDGLSWTFLTNHAHVLLCLFHNPEVKLREVALLVGITERMVQKIVAELAVSEYVEITRVGRRNRYQVHRGPRLRHPLESHRRIGDLLDLLDSGNRPENGQ